MNDKADKHAKLYLRKCIKHKRQHVAVQLWYEPLALFLNGVKQSTVRSSDIYSSLVKEKSYNYWKTHHDFKITDPDKVDWKPLKKAVKRLPVGLQRWNVKFTTGCLGTRHMLHHWNKFDSPQCPNCDHHTEKSSHVLRCNNQKTKTQFKKNLSDIKKCLSKSETYEPTQTAILKILSDYRDHKPISPALFATTFGLRAAIIDQEQIGWDNFLLG